MCSISLCCASIETWCLTNSRCKTYSTNLDSFQFVSDVKKKKCVVLFRSSWHQDSLADVVVPSDAFSPPRGEGIIHLLPTVPSLACPDEPCLNGGMCHPLFMPSGATAFFCNCPLHYTGRLCEKGTISIFKILYFPECQPLSYHLQPMVCFVDWSLDLKRVQMNAGVCWTISFAVHS